MKVCYKCKGNKSTTEFAKDRSKPDGLQNKCKACDKAYRATNKESRSRYGRQYYKDNKDFFAKYGVQYQRERCANDPAFRLLKNLRCRVYKAMRGIGKDSSTMELLGCTAKQFREHIESQFVDGMTFDNTHIDHIIPISAFDMTKPKHQRYAMHWSNCQPLFAEDNLRKSDSFCPKEKKKYLASALIPYSSQGKDEKR